VNSVVGDLLEKNFKLFVHFKAKFKDFYPNFRTLQRISTIFCTHKLVWILYKFSIAEVNPLSTSGDMLRQIRLKTLE
jgi:hypothetical protein